MDKIQSIREWVIRYMKKQITWEVLKTRVNSLGYDVQKFEDNVTYWRMENGA